MFYEFAQGEENKINIITLQKQFVWSSTFENGKGFEKKKSFSKEGRKKEKKYKHEVYFTVCFTWIKILRNERFVYSA